MSFLDEMVSGQLSAEHLEQGSDKWHDERCGRFTASEIWKLMVEPKTIKDKDAGKWSDTAMKYIMQKVVEKLTGQIKHESYAYPLVYGKETEPEAAEYFQEQTGHTLEITGFQKYSDYAGGSPDRFIGTNELVEIKCPIDDTVQLERLKYMNPMDLMLNDREAYWQIQSNLLFSGREKGYFVSYSPRFKEKRHKMKVLDIPKDDWAYSTITVKLEKAIEELLKQLASL